MKTGFLPAVLFFAVALVSGVAQANSMLVSPNPNLGEKFALQGDCSHHGINPAEVPNVDLTRSTLACYGASQQMLRIFYREGPQECVYIDNFNRDGDQIRAFFIPLNSSDEWIAFSSNLPGGVRLRYGCPGQIMKDACGNPFGLPDMPASDDPKDVIQITTPGGYKGQFSCPMTLDDGKQRTAVGGCGAWKVTKEEGDCVPVAVSTISEPLPGTGNPGTTSILPENPLDVPGIDPGALPPHGMTPSSSPPPGMTPGSSVRPGL
jgi:hypothetical protein